MEKLQMKDDESIRDYVQRVTKVVVGIINCGGTYDEEVIAKILRSLKPAYKTKALTIQETITLTTNQKRDVDCKDNYL